MGAAKAEIEEWMSTLGEAEWLSLDFRKEVGSLVKRLGTHFKQDESA